MVLVQTGSETVSGNMGMPRPETKQSGVFGKIPDLDWDCGVWSGPDQVPIGPVPNFPNTSWKWIEPLEVEVRLRRDMEDWGDKP